jgi:tetratricopeptide (TPR) repeat protein
MAYPGDGSLDQKVQQRILKAFAEAVRLYRENHPEESRTILRSITDVDPRFAPAQRLEQAISAGAPVDLSQLIGEVSAQPSLDVDATVGKARTAMADRDFQGALTLSQSILRELPGHVGARHIALEAQARIRASAEVQNHLGHARDALAAGLTDEARRFLTLAKSLDPTHPDLAQIERGLPPEATPPPAASGQDFEFEVFEPDAMPPPPPASAPTVTAAAAPPPPPSPRVSPQASAPPGSVLPVGPLAPLPVAAAPTTPAAPSAQEELGAFEFDVPGDAMPPLGRPATGPGTVQPAAFPPPPAPVSIPSAQLPPAAPPAPSAVAPAPAAPAPAAPGLGGIQFDTGAIPAPSFGAAGGAEDEAGARLQALLDQGQADFDAGDFQAAIDTWSRIYLIDAHNAEAELRIEQARRQREEVDRLAEHRFYEAREAFDQGRWDDARSLCQAVLGLQPQHLDAHDLLLRLDTPAAPPPPPSAPASATEDDLFRDDFVPATITAAASAPVGRIDESVADRAAATMSRGPRLGRVEAPQAVWLAVAAGLLVVLAAGGWLLRGKVFSGGGSVAVEALAESERLATQGRLQEAIQLLQTLQVEGSQGNQINQRILEYKSRLKKQAAPVRGVDTKSIKEALAAGQRLKALGLVREGLARQPADPELIRLQGEVLNYSPVLSGLADAIGARNWDAARALAQQLKDQHPGDPEAERAWVVATFNDAVTLLRKYQVAQGHELLEGLAKASPDAEVERLRQLAKSYLSRPADPRYQIFVSNVELRSLE